MNHFLVSLLILFVLATSIAFPQSPPEVGEPAPDFELRDASGKLYKLSDFRGEKLVVLEFFRSGDW